MTVSYKLIPTSGKLASKKPFKALCAPYATASLQEMGRNIERGTTFSMSDLAGALEALSKELKAQLLAGNRVHLPGLGFFSLAIKGELRTHPRTHRPRLLRPQVRTIRFQPEKEVMGQMKEAKFVLLNQPRPNKAMPSASTIASVLAEAFAAAPILQISDLRDRFQLSTAKTYALARQLEAEGKLINVGSKWHKVFQKGAL